MAGRILLTPRAVTGRVGSRGADFAGRFQLGPRSFPALMNFGPVDTVPGTGRVCFLLDPTQATGGWANPENLGGLLITFIGSSTAANPNIFSFTLKGTTANGETGGEQIKASTGLVTAFNMTILGQTFNMNWGLTPLKYQQNNVPGIRDLLLAEVGTQVPFTINTVTVA
jgi:hypothetical protein